MKTWDSHKIKKKKKKAHIRDTLRPEVHAAESRQESLTSRKEYIDPRKTRDQALSLWNGGTNSKIADYQRTNPRGYQIVRTHTKETTVIQDPASPNHQ